MNLAFMTSTGSIIDRLIALKTNSSFVHVELWMTGAKEEALCFSSRLPGGTGYVTLDLSQPQWTLIEIPATPEQMKAVSMFTLGTGKKRYDVLGILGFMSPWSQHDDAAVFCSEWCTTAMQGCLGLFLTDGTGKLVKPYKTSPADLYALATKIGKKS